MSQAVDIVFGVIERMDLTDKDIELLIARLNANTSTKQIAPKPMTEKELFIRRFEIWVVEKKILFPPKNRFK